MSAEGALPTSGQPISRLGETSRSPSPATASSSTMSSPPISRKRTNDQIYSSKDSSITERPRTAPEQGEKPARSAQFEQNEPNQNTSMPTARSFDSTVATLSTQPSNASTALTAPDAPQTFVSQIQELQLRLDGEYDQYVGELENRDRKEHLDAFDWDDLEARYLEEMEPAIRNEQEIRTQLAGRYKVFRSMRLRLFIKLMMTEHVTLDADIKRPRGTKSHQEVQC